MLGSRSGLVSLLKHFGFSHIMFIGTLGYSYFRVDS